MRIDISKLDIEYMDKSIIAFEARTKEDAYLFMTEETARALDNVGKIDEKALDYNDDGILSYYEWNKIYINNDLDFGEIEIR